MSKIAVVYWSGTGNTEQMANYIAEGAKENGATVNIYTAADFKPEMADDFEAIAFGCPSMGAEVLEESEFQPMWDCVELKLKEKKIALFGSYGWGDGEWMRDWKEKCEQIGAIFSHDYVICNDAPDEEAIHTCKLLGKALI